MSAYFIIAVISIAIIFISIIATAIINKNNSGNAEGLLYLIIIMFIIFLVFILFGFSYDIKAKNEYSYYKSEIKRIEVLENYIAKHPEKQDEYSQEIENLKNKSNNWVQNVKQQNSQYGRFSQYYTIRRKCK